MGLLSKSVKSHTFAHICPQWARYRSKETKLLWFQIIVADVLFLRIYCISPTKACVSLLAYMSMLLWCVYETNPPEQFRNTQIDTFLCKHIFVIFPSRRRVRYLDHPSNAHTELTKAACRALDTFCPPTTVIPQPPSPLCNSWHMKTNPSLLVGEIHSYFHNVRATICEHATHIHPYRHYYEADAGSNMQYISRVIIVTPICAHKQ